MHLSTSQDTRGLYLRTAPFLAVTLLLILRSTTVLASDPREADRPPRGPQLSYSPVIALAGVTSVGTIALRPDLLLARSSLVSTPGAAGLNQVKGEIGERLAMLMLNGTGGWRQITSRKGPKGIDSAYVRQDFAGNPRSLMLVEAKYGSSRLGRTKDGLQMGKEWCAGRLRELAGRYKALARYIDQGRLVADPGATIEEATAISFPVASGEIVTFGRVAGERNWVLRGDDRLLREARVALARHASVLEAGAEGRIKFRRLLVRADWFQGVPHLRIKNLADLDSLGTEVGIPEREVRLPDGLLGRAKRMPRDVVYEALRRQGQFEDEEAACLADHLAGSGQLDALLRAPNATWRATVLRRGVEVGAAGALLAVALQASLEFLGPGHFDSGQVLKEGLLGFVSAGLGTIIGHQVVASLPAMPLLSRASATASRILGVEAATVARSAVGATVAGATAVLIYSYLGYTLGWHDLREANAQAIAGLGGLATGTVVMGGIYFLVQTFGMTSAGIAIGSLSGAALTNATMAWFGGGALSAGGFGMAGGSVVYTGGLILVPLLVTAGIAYTWHLWNEGEDLRRMKLWVRYLKGKTTRSKEVKPADDDGLLWRAVKWWLWRPTPWWIPAWQ